MSSAGKKADAVADAVAAIVGHRGAAIKPDALIVDDVEFTRDGEGYTYDDPRGAEVVDKMKRLANPQRYSDWTLSLKVATPKRGCEP